MSVYVEFQSTPPARGATILINSALVSAQFQSTPPARGATGISFEEYDQLVISIHAPREGGDVRKSQSLRPISSFQSTPPARGATGEVVGMARGKFISIHAPREGGDQIRAS